METFSPEPTARPALSVAYRFADVSVEPRRRQVLRAGRAVHVEPKVFDLISYLLVNRDRVVLHETLLRDVWGGVVVAQTAITQCVAQARRVLGDSARAPRFIRTYHRLGYQFVGEVEEVAIGTLVGPSTNVLTFSSPLRADEGEEIMCAGAAVAAG